MAIKLEITMTNKWLYSLIVVGIVLALSVGIWAYNSDMRAGNPPVMGHSAGEINVENSAGQVVSLQDALDNLNQVDLSECTNMGYDEKGYGTSVCPTSNGIVLVKTSNGNNADNGISSDWHTKRHLTGKSFDKCTNMGYDGKGYGTSVCSGSSGVALIKTSNGNNADNGISSDWHVSLHE
jgi:hypothetical protein